MAGSLNNLANLYRDQGEYAKAEPLYHGAHDILQHLLRAEQRDRLPSLSKLADLCAVAKTNLAALYKDQGKFAETEQLYVEAQRLLEEHVGLESFTLAATLSNLAILYKEQGRFREAEPPYLRSQRIWEQHLGPEHTQVALLFTPIFPIFLVLNRNAMVSLLVFRCDGNLLEEGKSQAPLIDASRAG